MANIIQKIGILLAMLVFFIILFVGIFSSANPDLFTIIEAIFKASVGAAVFWLIGIVLGDIVLKGIIENIEVNNDNKWSGGLVTRFTQEKEREKRPSLREEIVDDKKEEKGKKEK